MLDDPPKPVTVEELLPALVELASIQHDLLRVMAPPNRPGGEVMDNPGNIAAYKTQLLDRSRQVLAWLFERAKGSA